MIDLTWSSDTTQNPISLADAIELAVAFAEDDYYSRFTRADFQHVVDSENLSDDGSSYLDGDLADERVKQFEQALALIQKRASWLGVSYPFIVETDQVQLVSDNTESRCLPYLFLLLCSNTDFVPSLKTVLPVHFEDLCKEALRALFPEWAEVLLFSQNSEDRKTVFGWSASEAIPKLAKKLNAEMVNADRISDTQREYGVDIVAICPFDDQSPYPFFALAQCTLRQDWWEKRHEATSSNGVAAFVHLNTNHSNLLMVPYFPRYELGAWSEDPSRTGNCILCDRYRICRLLEKSNAFDANNLPVDLRDIFQTIEHALPEITLD